MILRRVTSVSLFWFSAVSSSQQSCCLERSILKPFLNNLKLLMYCCTYRGHKMHVCWMKTPRTTPFRKKHLWEIKLVIFTLSPSLHREDTVAVSERWWPHHWLFSHCGRQVLALRLRGAACSDRTEARHSVNIEQLPSNLSRNDEIKSHRFLKVDLSKWN